jgi:hypothetical protein
LQVWVPDVRTEAFAAEARRQVLRVTADEDVGVIGVGDEWAMRAAPLGVVSGAVVVSVTGSSTR